MKTVYLIEYHNGMVYDDEMMNTCGVVADKELAESIVEKLNNKLKKDYEQYCYLSNLTVRTDDEQKEYDNNYIHYMYHVDHEDEGYYYNALIMYESINEIEA